MAGWNTICEMHRLEAEVDKLGFKMANARHSDMFGELVSLIPKDANALPIYSRDAEIFSGTLEALQYWLRGVTWARDYDGMIRLTDIKKRERKEQDERNHQLVKRLKNENAVVIGYIR